MKVSIHAWIRIMYMRIVNVAQKTDQTDTTIRIERKNFEFFNCMLSFIPMLMSILRYEPFRIFSAAILFFLLLFVISRRYTHTHTHIAGVIIL